MVHEAFRSMGCNEKYGDGTPKVLASVLLNIRIIQSYTYLLERPSKIDVQNHNFKVKSSIRTRENRV